MAVPPCYELIEVQEPATGSGVMFGKEASLGCFEAHVRQPGQDLLVALLPLAPLHL